MGFVRSVLRLLGKLVPTTYTSRRDRLTQEQDELSMQNNFRAGL